FLFSIYTKYFTLSTKVSSINTCSSYVQLRKSRYRGTFFFAAFFGLMRSTFAGRIRYKTSFFTKDINRVKETSFCCQFFHFSKNENKKFWKWRRILLAILCLVEKRWTK
ncbi:hypothetical protein DSI02_13390, partial [Enterococcus faecium]